MKHVLAKSAFLALAIHCPADCATPLVESLVHSIQEIRTISADFTATIKPSRIPGALEVQGRTLFYQYSWLLDRSQGWQLFDGEHGITDDDQWTYQKQVFAWDGTDYIAYTPGLSRALKSGDPWFSFAATKSPAVLIGDNLLSRFSIGLPEVLDQAIHIRTEDNRLSAEFDWELRGGAPTHKIVVDIIAGRHCLPKRIAVTELSRGADVTVVEVDSFTDGPAGEWRMPISGSIETFQPIRLSDGSVGQRSLGVGRMHIAIDPLTLSVNENLARSRFSIHLPSTVSWLDERTGETFKSEAESINDVPEATNIPAILLALVSVGVVLVLLIGSRRK